MPEVGREGDQNGGGGESLWIGRRGRVAVSPSRRPGGGAGETKRVYTLEHRIKMWNTYGNVDGMF